jgi:hypothetical protein
MPDMAMASLVRFMAEVAEISQQAVDEPAASHDINITFMWIVLFFNNVRRNCRDSR